MKIKTRFLSQTDSVFARLFKISNHMLNKQTSWLQLALQVRGSVIPAIFPRVLLCIAVSLFIAIMHYIHFSLPGDIFGSVTSNIAYNLVLGLLLVFRTNTAYDRYWEGRKVWGGIVINILNLGRKIRQGVIVSELSHQEDKTAILKLISAFAIATKLHLRQEAPDNKLEVLISQPQYLQLKAAASMPLQIIVWIGDALKQMQLKNRLSMDEYLNLNTSVDNLVEALMGVERILRTPIPLAYAIYLKRLLLIYCIVLPLQLVDKLNWWTPLIVGLISFILLGIEEIGNQIEDPFGKDGNDLPLDDICDGVVKNIQNLMIKD